MDFHGRLRQRSRREAKKYQNQFKAGSKQGLNPAQDFDRKKRQQPGADNQASCEQGT